MINKKKIDIIGAGPAGLTAGYYAIKKGYDVKIYEASNATGGNCKTIIDGEFRFDTGAHRLHDKIGYVTNEIKKLLGDDLQLVNAPSKIYLNNNFIDFPIKLGDVFQKMDISTILNVISENIFNNIKQERKINSFKHFAYKKYGETLSKLVLIPYTEKLWGKNSDELDPVISGGRLKSLNILSAINSNFRLYKNNSKHFEGEFYYPRLGFGTIFEKLNDFIGNKNVFTKSSIINIYHKNNKITSMDIAKGNNKKVEYLINTMPLGLLLSSLKPAPPEKILDVLKNINFRNLKICVIHLDMKSFTNNASIYFPDSDCPFTRIYEPKNRSQEMAPSNKTSIVVEVPIGDKNISENINEDDIYNLIITYLKKKRLLNIDEIIRYRFFDIFSAYPIILKEKQYQIEMVMRYLSKFNNMDVIGRNATFEYLHTHMLFDKSKKLIENLNF